MRLEKYNVHGQVSNLDDSIDFVVKSALELPLKWGPADYNTKQHIQFYAALKVLVTATKQMKVEPQE